ncbi:HutD/Ves family protein [Sphingopyxis sp. MWB1]|uniref:HutD/Ves family protein n=1 Tax=Sphingopyxis sp. MWB1 TaxID=1537715 RepID=UPI00068DF1BD|nr:HutD family protein [Sphingopyxis sp. MWB1]
MSDAPLILRAGERSLQPWRNGGGVTQEIWVDPPGAGDGDFLWRASLATIDTPGNFSDWPGIERLLVPLTGVLELNIEGETICLAPGDEGRAFPGEAQVSGRPLDGRCSVLNIMTRRGRMLAKVPRSVSLAGQVPGPRPKQRLVVAREREAVETGETRLVLEAGDALLLNGDGVTDFEDKYLIILDLFSA